MTEDIQRRKRQRGQAMIIFALAGTFIVGIAGLAIEGGMLEGDRRFNQAISDGAALAGAHLLPADSAGALQRAARYAVASLNGGAIPAGCSPSPLYVNNSSTPLPAACDPGGGHSLLMQAPYNGRADQILVRLDHTLSLNLAAVVGARAARTASRSVALSYGGGQAFGFTVYANGNMLTNGNVDTVVRGNVYTRGCIQFNASDNFYVLPQGSQVGSVEVYDDPAMAPVQAQTWTSGSSSGCNAKVFGNTGPGQWGASGHTAGAQNCAPAPSAANQPGFVTGTCPSGEPPVSLVTVPLYRPSDTTGSGGRPCNQTTPGTFSAPGLVAVAGCYSACASGGSGSVHIPDGTVFGPGTYAFVGNGSSGGCNVEFDGSASNLINASPFGVTFFLYNGASMCASACGTSNAQGTITLSAPTDSTNPNFGMLVYSCNSSDCLSGAGIFDIEGPQMNINLKGLIYNPGGNCLVTSNASEVIFGQLICKDITLQGGSVSTGTGVTYGGVQLPIPIFQATLIE